MGGRGGSSGRSGGGGGGSARQSADVKRMFIEQGLNSNIAGVRKKAEQGTGNYSFKDATPIGENDVQKMKVQKVIERNGYTLLDGTIGEKSVCFGSESSNPTIKKVKEQLQKAKEKRAKEAEESQIKTMGSDKPTTTTYERWRKRNAKNFEDWYYGK